MESLKSVSMSYIIAIAGGSCSGKTTLARHLQRRLGPKQCLLVRQDDYYHDISERDSSQGLPNFDIPEALDFNLLADDLSRLKRGEAVALPNYDFTTHQRRRPAEPAEPRPFIIVEGMLILHAPQLQSVLDRTLYLRCESTRRLERRLARDVAERGRTQSCVIKQFSQDVEPAHEHYVAPSADNADDIIEQDEYMSDLSGLVERISGGLPPISSKASSLLVMSAAH
ncbi:uridine kinase family protein [Robiginitomaculum antarcticum]|uniref:uridine kinase family protein n=1 Tax=Robiginitomaculum antarcticum TaxID=437507 RepID=UPI0003A76B8A|nr:uridine kinase [Robiginitomaculum antarcticum]